MSKNYLQTFRNGERHYSFGGYSCVAKIMGNEGFTVRIDTSRRSYFAISMIDRGAQLLTMEIYPGIHCCKEAQGQVSEYISKINAKYKCCNLRLSFNGDVHTHAEQRFDDNPVSAEMFKIMECECMKILDTFENVLEKLAHMKLLESDEADVDKMIEKHLEKVKKTLAEKLSERLSKNSDDDEDDCDDDDGKSCFGSDKSGSAFTDWLKRRAVEGDQIARRVLEGRERGEEKEEEELPFDSPRSTLLEELLAISDEENTEAEEIAAAEEDAEE